MRIDELKPGMVIRFPEEGFPDDEAEVLRIDHDNSKVYFYDLTEDFEFDASFDEVEEIAKPL